MRACNVSEIFYAAYFSYYIMITGVGVALFVRQRSVFYHYMSVVSFVFYVGYLTYMCVPVMGPRVFQSCRGIAGVGADSLGNALYFTCEKAPPQHGELASMTHTEVSTPSRMDLVIIADGVPSSAIRQVHQDAGALHMAQKVVAKADASVSALNESRDVHHDKGLIVPLHDAQHRLQCGERVDGYLGLCSADGQPAGGTAS